jgi:hypothetical protein
MAEGVSVEQVLQAVEAHRRAMTGDCREGQVLKRDTKTNVTLVAWDLAQPPSAGIGKHARAGAPVPQTERVCVKEFVRAGARRLLPRPLRHRPAVAAWRAANRLAALGIGAPHGLGLLFGRGASSYFVMTALENSEHLAAYARRTFPALRSSATTAGGEESGRSTPLRRKRAFLRAGAEFLRKCYAAGVFHRDLKAGNLFVRETEARTGGPFDAAHDGWEFMLLDLGDVRFLRRIRLEDKLLNLAQLNASTPIEITWTDRMRFLRYLAEDSPALAERPAMAEIARLTASRRCVWLP